MGKKSISSIVANMKHWPLAKQRQYLILAVKCEKGKLREEAAIALRTVTTQTLQHEMGVRP